MARRADSGKQRRWLQLIRSWQQSQLTVRAFCSRHRLSEPSFYAWRRLLQQRGLIQDEPTALQPSSRRSQPPTFVKLSLANQPPACHHAVEVVLGARLLRVCPGFDPDTVRQLVRLLEKEPC
jgi:hypothetical protein